MEIQIFNQNNNESQTINLDSKVWSHEFSPYLISLYNRFNLFSRRNTISKTKTKGEVSGGGRKPWRQKGTGRARQGSIRSPQWKGGGVVFGPTGNQNYEISVNKKEKKNALSSLLSIKLLENEILVFDKIIMDNYKTKDALAFLKRFNLESKKVLLVLSYPNEFNDQLKKSFDNLRNVNLTSPTQINISKVLNSHFVLFTKEAFAEMEAKLSRI